MKKSFLLIVLIMLFSVVSCGGGDTDYVSPTGKVTVLVYNCSGEVLSAFKVDEEGDLKIQLDSSYTGDLMVVASRDGAYSELYPTNNGGIITVKLDSVENDGNYHGVVFGYGGRYMDFQKMDYEGLVFSKDGGGYITTPSNVYARYTIADGNYTTVDSNGMTASESATFTPNERYKYEDIFFKYLDDGDTADTAKPNIYLYPESTIDLFVSIAFPQGGHVTASDPGYGNGWDVTVDPDGTIDNYHTFLFYEALVPA
ncbi:hypothetical protein KAH37_01695, partial [bacterium]|nr:hypothetical protein [bacterium]